MNYEDAYCKCCVRFKDACICESGPAWYYGEECPHCLPLTNYSTFKGFGDGMLHALELDPEWEYATTEGPRKMWIPTPPDGEGWRSNRWMGRDGWERFDAHEECYWMRRKSEMAVQAS